MKLVRVAVHFSLVSWDEGQKEFVSSFGSFLLREVDQVSTWACSAAPAGSGACKKEGRKEGRK